MGGADMTNDKTMVGLDVHARATLAAVLELDTGELWFRRLVGRPCEAVAFLAGLQGRVLAVYEAGPTGYGLARAGAAGGIDVRVCAPGLIPRRPADRVKTDKRDAERLARLLAAGELSFVRVPSIEEEQQRDLARCREAARGDLMRARHRLTKLLLRREIYYPGPGKAWTQAHWQWLGALTLDDQASRAVLEDYLTAVRALQQRRDELDRQITQLAQTSPWAITIGRLRCFRGIDTVTAFGLCSEIGDFQRFAHPRTLSAFLGIVPSEHSSGAQVRRGPITKAGSAHARRLLVEAAQHYRVRPAIGVTIARRQHGQDPRACEIAWRCQRRLHHLHQQLRVKRGKPGNVVTVALARELCNFIWEAAQLR
jgi:transposase